MGGDGKPVEQDVARGGGFRQRSNFAHDEPADGQHKDPNAQGHMRGKLGNLIRR